MNKLFKNNLIIILFSIFLLLILNFVYYIIIKNKNFDINRNFIEKEKIINEYLITKSDYSFDNSKTLINKLKNNPNLIKEENKNKNIHLEFGNLSSNEFDSLFNQIINSKLIIKKLSIFKDSNNQGNIIVEFES